MKLSDLKIGDSIKHFCRGELVEGTVIDTDGRGIVSSHKPIVWGNQVCRETWINPSTNLQKSISQTTPKAFYKDEEITV